MRYLFFDLEEASSAYNHIYICEFGYVLTDENFKILEQDNFIINPRLPRRDWDWFAVRKILTRPITEYENSLDFDFYYPNIYKLLKNADYIFGHTTEGDVRALNQEFERHKHKPLDFAFYDIMKLYKAYTGISKSVSLENMIKELEIKDSSNTLHDAQSDAFNTMLCMKKMLSNVDVKLDDLIELSPECMDETKDFILSSNQKKTEKLKKKDAEILKSTDDSNDIHSKGKQNYIHYMLFLDNVKSQGNGNGIFNGKKISISINYQEHHYRQLLNLIQLITNEGGHVHLKASEADIVVKYELKLDDGSFRKDSRYEAALRANEYGANIEIIEFNELLTRLGITEEELDAMPLPSFDFMYEKDAIIKNNELQKAVERRNCNYVVKEVKTETETCDDKVTLGDVFGDVFDKLYASLEDDK